ncbi:hypothetical protein ACFXP3_33135 [Streptomyces sp. NPDC059096]|uniref:hypothetical protein n=1 Tax=Streptomyces sp. NPDC059096 TaxID=3346727 RepID=UPI0036BF6254
MNALGEPEPESPTDGEAAGHSPAERTALRRVTERLTASFPTVDHNTVDTSYEQPTKHCATRPREEERAFGDLQRAIAQLRAVSQQP